VDFVNASLGKPALTQYIIVHLQESSIIKIMSLEQQLSQLPKGLLAVIVISGFVFLLYTMNPPHSICDTEAETVKENLVGVLYPQKIKKNTIPPRLPEVMRSCEYGRSAGGCYEYFELLKFVAKQLDGAAPECRSQVFEVPQMKKVIEDGVQNMALLAWGQGPPATPNERFGWLQESELAVFCYLRDVYVKVLGESGWSALRSHVYKKYPAGTVGTDKFEDEKVPKAIENMPENQIWQKSIFAIRCENVH
jgi:hypothetical protein